MNEKEVAGAGRLLRMYAEHFAHRDWDWTRKHNIKRIVYGPRRVTDRRTGETRERRDVDHPIERAKQAARYILRGSSPLMPEFDPGRFRMARAAWRVSNSPDGHLDNGGVIAHWEETGEYLQLVQPSVGSRVADFLEAEPGHPHAIAIASEIRRHQDRYSARIRANGGRAV